MNLLEGLTRRIDLMTDTDPAFTEGLIDGLRARVRYLEKELEFERKVNSRVNEIFKGWFHNAS